MNVRSETAEQLNQSNADERIKNQVALSVGALVVLLALWSLYSLYRPPDGARDFTRVGGRSRIETSIEAARLWPQSGPIVVAPAARATSSQRMLAAGREAARLDAPLLLVGETLSKATRRELKRRSGQPDHERFCAVLVGFSAHRPPPKGLSKLVRRCPGPVLDRMTPPKVLVHLVGPEGVVPSQTVGDLVPHPAGWDGEPHRAGWSGGCDLPSKLLELLGTWSSDPSDLDADLRCDLPDTVVFATAQNYPDVPDVAVGIAVAAHLGRASGANHTVVITLPRYLESDRGLERFLHERGTRVARGVVIGESGAVSEELSKVLRSVMHVTDIGAIAQGSSNLLEKLGVVLGLLFTLGILGAGAAAVAGAAAGPAARAISQILQVEGKKPPEPTAAQYRPERGEPPVSRPPLDRKEAAPSPRVDGGRQETRDDARTGRIAQLGPTFFFGLAVGYLVLLLLLAVGRETEFWILDDIDDPIAGVLPLGVPWFGALGAVTISIYGVFDHNDQWDSKWNYWHIARPLVGIILAIVAYFIFITVISSTGLTPRTSATTSTIVESTTTSATTMQTSSSQAAAQPTQASPATVPSTTSLPGQTGGSTPAPSSLLPYYVLAFLVGFREETFRNLIQRAADVLLGPGDRGAPPAGTTVQPAPIQFKDVPVGDVKVETVTVTNTGTGDLRIHPSSTTSRGTDLSDKNGVFSLSANSVEGATIAPGAHAALRVEFKPKAAGTYAGTLTISSNAGTNPIDILGEATAQPRQAQPRQAAGWRWLRRMWRLARR